MPKKTDIKFDYTARDYQGYLNLFKDNIPNLAPEWTDLSDTDMGMAILSLVAVGFDTQAYQIDKATRENLLPLAKTRRAILMLTKFLGYEIEWQKAAYASQQRFTKRDSKLDAEVFIPRGTQVSTNPELGTPIVFETERDLIIPPGDTYGDVPIVQGTTYENVDIGVSSGEKYQTFTVPYIDVLKESVLIETEERGTKFEWSFVPDFLESTPNSRHFTLTPTEDAEVEVTFGDGKAGRIPDYGSTVYASFREGGGTVGNVAEGLVNNLVVDITDIASTENIDPTQGGLDFEDLELVREKAPKAKRSGGVAVTPTDFEDIAELTPGIRRAVCVETFNADNELKIYLATMDGVPYTQELADTVKQNLSGDGRIDRTLTVLPVSYRDIDLALTLYLYPDIDPNVAKFESENITRDFFDPNTFEFAETVYLGQVAAENYQVRGVKNAVVTSPESDIVMGETELPRLRTLTVTVVGG